MKVKIKKNVLRLTLNGADTQGDSFSELSMQLQHLGIMCHNVVPEKNKTTFEYNIEGLYSLHLLSKQAEYAMVNAVCEQLLLLERACLDLGLPRDRFLLSEKFSFMDANGQLKVVYLPVDERAECSCPLDFAYSFLNSNSKKLNPDALDYLNGRLSSVAAELSGAAFVQAEELAKPAELISDGAEDSSYFVDRSSVMCPVSETDIQDLLSYSEAFSSEQAQEPSFAIDEPTVGFAQAQEPSFAIDEPTVGFAQAQEPSFAIDEPTVGFAQIQEPSYAIDEPTVGFVKGQEPSYAIDEPTVGFAQAQEPSFAIDEPTVGFVKGQEPSFAIDEPTVGFAQAQEPSFAIDEPTVGFAQAQEPSFANDEPTVGFVKGQEPSYAIDEPTVGFAQAQEPSYAIDEPTVGFAQAQEPSYAIDEPTVGFAQAPAPVQPSVPVTCCLVRYYNSEIINIAKPVFTLGTARDCDYCVSDNRKISKHHGQIIWFAPEGRFCFIDCGSTNKSSINGETLVPGERYALESGAKIVMADEIFNFYM